jgi:hypothetical protein
MNIKDYINKVDESSLNRIKDAIDNHTCGAITSFRGNRTRQENLENNKQILAVLKTKGFSITTVKGSYVENFKSDNEKEVGERSFFVVNRKVDGNDNGELEKVLRALGEKYDQDSILIVYKGEGTLIGTSRRDDAYPSYGKKEYVGKGKFGKASGEFFSRVKGRQFAFEEVKEPDSIMGKHGMRAMGMNIIKELNL